MSKNYLSFYRFSNRISFVKKYRILWKGKMESLCPFGLFDTTSWEVSSHFKQCLMASGNRAEKRVYLACVVHNGAFEWGEGEVLWFGRRGRSI